jgi:hypothetical protein
MKISAWLRFIWLLPATFLVFLLDLFALQTAVLPVILGFAMKAGTVFTVLITVAAAAGMTYVVFRAWRRTIRSIKGFGPEPSGRASHIAQVSGFLAFFLFFGFVVWPQFAALLKYAAENGQRGDAARVRAELETFREKHAAYPVKAEDLAEMLRSLDIKPLWRARLVKFPHPPTSDIVFYPGKEIRDSGKWAYVNDPSSPDYGDFYVDCSHRTAD